MEISNDKAGEQQIKQIPAKSTCNETKSQIKRGDSDADKKLKYKNSTSVKLIGCWGKRVVTAGSRANSLNVHNCGSKTTVSPGQSIG